MSVWQFPRNFIVAFTLGCATAFGMSTSIKRELQGASIQISLSTIFQTMEGFGASDAFNTKSGALTSDQAKLFFSVDEGIGLSLLRVQVPDDGSCIPDNSGPNPSNLVACAGGASTVADIIAASGYGAKIWAAPWSPPKQFKTNGKVVRGSLKQSSYSDYADYLFNFVHSVKMVTNVDLYALSVQNEPNNHVSYDSAAWTGKQLRSFVDSFLGPRLSGSDVRIMIPETSSFSKMAEYLKGGIPARASIIAFHGYDGKIPSNPYPDRSLWQTEVSGNKKLSLKGGTWDPSIKDGILWAELLHNMLAKGNLNAWNWWWLVGHPGKPSKQNQALISKDGQVSKRLYTIGQYSKFVRPGFIRVGATSSASKVLVSAYKNPTGRHAVVVVVNTSTNSMSQTFSITAGFSIPFVTPWVTSADLSLEPQSNVDVTFAASPSGGPDNFFSYTLPAMSVTSFVY